MAIRILAISALLAALVGCASAPSTRAGNTAAQPLPMVADRDALYCAPPPASRIAPDPRHCSTGAANVRTFTGEQLEQTGATQVGDALHYLDPEITITHH